MKETAFLSLAQIITSLLWQGAGEFIGPSSRWANHTRVTGFLIGAAPLTPSRTEPDRDTTGKERARRGNRSGTLGGERVRSSPGLAFSYGRAAGSGS